MSTVWDIFGVSALTLSLPISIHCCQKFEIYGVTRKAAVFINWEGTSVKHSLACTVMSTLQVSLMSRLWPCLSSFAYIKSGQTRSESGNKMSIDRTTVLPRLCIKLLCTEHDLWVVSLNWLAGFAPSWHKVSSRMVWLCQNVHPVNEWVFVGVCNEWRVELVEKDGQKSPAGISYKLHCNLLVLFLLFISRSKLEKQRENWGIFMTLWKELVTKTH